MNLVHDTGAGRDYAEVIEGLLAPLEELVPFNIPLELFLGVVEEGEGVGELVYLHGVVDHQINGDKRVDLLRVAAGAFHGGAHRGEIDHAGDAGEVLQDDSGDLEGHFSGGLPLQLQPASLVTSSVLTSKLSWFLRQLSRRTLMEKGSLSMWPMPALVKASRR